MIIRLNNISNYDSNNLKELKLLSHKYYPKQDLDMINKVIFLRYKNENNPNIINNRFYIIGDNSYIDNTGEYTGSPTLFLIIRFDTVYPFRAILISSKGEIITTTTDVIKSLIFPKGYKERFLYNSGRLSSFYNKKEIYYESDIDDENFLELIHNEYIHKYPIQNENYIGLPVYIEYLNDITDRTLTNILEPSKQKSFEEIKEQLLIGNPDLDLFPDCILKSFPHYYNKHGHDRQDVPRKVLSSGIIIRMDIGSDTGTFIVATFDKDNTVKFITNTEAIFYIESDLLNHHKPMKLRDIANLLDNVNIYQGDELL